MLHWLVLGHVSKIMAMNHESSYALCMHMGVLKSGLTKMHGRTVQLLVHS